LLRKMHLKKHKMASFEVLINAIIINIFLKILAAGQNLNLDL
jgi:hypothetical protein